MDTLMTLALWYWAGLAAHEAAHAVTAWACGMRVRRIFLWLDPGGLALARSRVRGTVLGLGTLPIGSYTDIEGFEELGHDAAPATPRAFTARPTWQQLLVVLAGPAACMLMAGALWWHGTPAMYPALLVAITMLDLVPTGPRDGNAGVKVLASGRDEHAVRRMWWAGWLLLLLAMAVMAAG